MPVQLTTNPDQPQRTQTVTLGDRQFRVRLTFRDRTSSWYFDLFAADETPLAIGRRLSPAWSPLAALVLVDGPDGVVLVDGPEPYARFDLGDTLKVLFVDDDEIPDPVVVDVPQVSIP